MNPASATLSQLTTSVFGRELSLADAWEVVSRVSRDAESTQAQESAWVGSVGYEQFRQNEEFAEAISSAGVEVLIDVRDLPISRKRGFAKTALSNALAVKGVEYRHWKALGNPKAIRDVYKSGEVERGRTMFIAHLKKSADQELDELATVVRERRCALMCVEHDASTCHRTDILDALAERSGFPVLVSHISQS